VSAADFMAENAAQEYWLPMTAITALGFLAGALTTVSFAPQVLKTWRTKRCDDLSLAMLLTFGSGVIAWLIYGLELHSPPIIATNAVTLVLIGMLFSMKLRYPGR
jgi:MtN3 and saliva related transmembrane protein